MPINYKTYPKDWKTRIRAQVRARSKGFCEMCNVKNGSLVWSVPIKGIRNKKHVTLHMWQAFDEIPEIPGSKLVKVVLTIAHLDHDHLNHKVDISRLMDMCQRCHLKYDSEKHAAKNKFQNMKKKVTNNSCSISCGPSDWFDKCVRNVCNKMEKPR
jgi:hypothetical protein